VCIDIGTDYRLIEALSMSKDTSSFYVVMARVLIKDAQKVTTEVQEDGKQMYSPAIR